MPVKFMQNIVVIPGGMSVAPSSSHLANTNPLWFCLVLQSFNYLEACLDFKMFLQK